MSNMYPWTSGSNGKTINPLRGKCPHQCKYCYVPHMMKIFPNIERKYTGDIALDENVLKSRIKGNGGTIFICSMSDLFASDIPKEFIIKILNWLKKEPKNRYLLQSKNPGRIKEFRNLLPHNAILGTTIESNIDHQLSSAPPPKERYRAMMELSSMGYQTMISIEPILQFDGKELVQWIEEIQPNFVSIGADSKNNGNGFLEPASSEIESLVAALLKITEVKCKKNLDRLL